MSQELLEALRAIKLKPATMSQGICGNLRTTVGDEKWKVMSLHLRALMDRWPEGAGCDGSVNRFYPVEGRVTQYMSDARQRKLWDNPRRIALLDWLIEKLEKANVLATLQTIKNCGPMRIDTGICGNVEDMTEEELPKWFKPLMDKWPEKAEGDSDYPVEGNLTAFNVHMMAETLWDNPRRIALLDWLIKELECNG